jgi:hypothetical protein
VEKEEAVDRRRCFPPAAPLLTHMQTEIISRQAAHKRKQLLVHNVCSVIAPWKKEKGCREKREEEILYDSESYQSRIVKT